MNKKLLITFSLFFVIITGYAQKPVLTPYEDSLCKSAMKNNDAGDWDILDDCKDCKEVTLTGIVTEILGTTESNDRFLNRNNKDTDFTDCDYTFNIKLNSQSLNALTKLYKSIHRNYTVKHLETLHVEAICANWDKFKKCLFCQGINVTAINNTLSMLNVKEYGTKVIVTGRLIVDGVKMVNGKNIKFDSYRPQFEIHPIYYIKILN